MWLVMCFSELPSTGGALSYDAVADPIVERLVDVMCSVVIG